MAKLRICIIIPAYNEAKVIGDVIKSIKKSFTKLPFSADIVVINDGSKDKTSKVSKLAGATVINHILNSGAGSATSTGLSYAHQNGYDLAATMDADGQHAPEDVISGIERIQNSNTDLLIGSRLIDSTGMPRIKVIGNKAASVITWSLFGVKVTDSQSGLRIFSKNAIERLTWKSTGYEFCSEMIWRAKQSGLNVAEYPIQAIYTDYSISKGQNNWNSVNIVKQLARQRIEEIFE